jgi:hypothetical protein
MKTVLSLAVLTTFFASPALAGDVFVFNQWTIKHNREESEVNVDYTTTSNNKKEYTSRSETLYFEDKTIHRAGSSLSGSFREDNTTRVRGTINTITNSYRSIHETSAGIR